VKRALVTGATGFLGEHVLRSCPSGWRAEVFARPSSDLSRLPAGTTVHEGDLGDPPSLRKALEGADALLNIASLGFGHAPAIVQAAREARVPRAVFFSTTAVFTKLEARSKAVRLEAERLVSESGLAFTLLRPTMIYGTPRDRNIWRLIRLLRWAPAVPLVEGGRRLQQPVFVEDAARAAWSALDARAAVGGAYDIPGAEALPFAEMVAIIAHLLGRRVAVVSIPRGAALAAAAAARCLPFMPKISSEQILRLEEDKAFDPRPAREAFGYAPLDFEAGVRRELEWL